MKNVFVAAVIFFGFTVIKAGAQTTASYNKKGYKLTFINYDSTLDTSEQQRMVKTFYKVYPELAKAYNKKTAKEVTFVIDTAYKVVAATDNGKVSAPICYKCYFGTGISVTQRFTGQNQLRPPNYQSLHLHTHYNITNLRGNIVAFKSWK